MKASHKRTRERAIVKPRVKPIKLRIIGGDMRGRLIQYHGADFTRPMKDSVRESVFNILGNSVRGAKCFDLFAGTGAMAFEALSRGASSAILVEQDRRAATVLEKTADSLDVGLRAKIITGDAFRLAPTLLGPAEHDTPWLVFLCPPYALWQSTLEGLSRIIRLALDHAPPGSAVVAEMESGFDAAKLPAANWDIRDYGGTRLALAKPAMQCGLSLECP